MKNYSRNSAAKGKTTFRTGDKWRARKSVAVRNIKSTHRTAARLKKFGSK